MRIQPTHSQLPPKVLSFRMPSAGLLVALLLSSCSGGSLPFFGNPASEAVVYALGPRDGYTAPLNGSLKVACPALVFAENEFRLSSANGQALTALHTTLKDDKKARLLIAGYAPPDLPPDHARSLSERRAQAVRQRLIELGMESANLQTVGYGNDFSFSGPSSGVVVIYRQ